MNISFLGFTYTIIFNSMGKRNLLYLVNVLQFVEMQNLISLNLNKTIKLYVNTKLQNKTNADVEGKPNKQRPSFTLNLTGSKAKKRGRITKSR